MSSESSEERGYMKELLEFLSDEKNREYCLPVVTRLLAQRKRKGFYVIKDEKFPVDDVQDKIVEICNALVRQSLNKGSYDASLVPTIISPEQAPNFYVHTHWITLWRFRYKLRECFV